MTGFVEVCVSPPPPTAVRRRCAGVMYDNITETFILRQQHISLCVHGGPKHFLRTAATFVAVMDPGTIIFTPWSI